MEEETTYQGGRDDLQWGRKMRLTMEKGDGDDLQRRIRRRQMEEETTYNGAKKRLAAGESTTYNGGRDVKVGGRRSAVRGAAVFVFEPATTATIATIVKLLSE